MAIEVSPELEDRLRWYAENEGVSVAELVERAFPPAPKNPAQNLIREWQKEDSTPVAAPALNDGTMTPSEALFHEWAQEDARKTDAQKAEDKCFWEAYTEGINENRRAAGMREIF